MRLHSNLAVWQVMLLRSCLLLRTFLILSKTAVAQLRTCSGDGDRRQPRAPLTFPPPALAARAGDQLLFPSQFLGTWAATRIGVGTRHLQHQLQSCEISIVPHCLDKLSWINFKVWSCFGRRQQQSPTGSKVGRKVQPLWLLFSRKYQLRSPEFDEQLLFWGCEDICLPLIVSTPVGISPSSALKAVPCFVLLPCKQLSIFT